MNVSVCAKCYQSDVLTLPAPTPRIDNIKLSLTWDRHGNGLETPCELCPKHMKEAVGKLVALLEEAYP